MRESDVNFFRPLWRRVLVSAICVAWFAFEAVYSHDQLWMAMSGVAVVYCAWNLFLKFPKDMPAAAMPTAPVPPPSTEEPPKQP